MTNLFRLSATAFAVATTLALTACGGGSDGSVFNNQDLKSPVFRPVTASSSSSSSSNSSSDSSTTTTTKENQDSSTYTTSTTYSSSNTTATGETVPTYYYAGKTRGSLMTEMANTFGATKSDGTARFESAEGYRATMNGETKRSIEHFDLSTLSGYNDLTLTETTKSTIDGVTYTGDRTSRVKLYQQDNSVVLGRQTVSGSLSDGTTTKTLSTGSLRIDNLKGTPTTNEQIKTLISDTTAQNFNYKGKAFSQGGSGDFEYSVDFVDRSGSGKITGLSDKGTINLNQGNFASITHNNPDDTVTDLATGEAVPNTINAIGITGVANFANGSTDGTYTLGFFGDNAVEVAGFVTEDNVNTVGFGGKKQ